MTTLNHAHEYTEQAFLEHGFTSGFVSVCACGDVSPDDLAAKDEYEAEQERKWEDEYEAESDSPQGSVGYTK